VSSVLRFLVSALVGSVISAGALVFVGRSDTTTKILSAAPSTSLVSQPAAGQLTANQLYRRASSGVVSIQARSGNGTATGSGFEIDSSGLILTNQHVIDGASEVTVSIDSGITRTGRVVGFDRSTDLALLKIDAGGVGLHPLRLADSSRTQVGDRAYAIGDPFGLDRTLTAGVVSALQRHIDAPNGFSIDHVIQTDAALNPGNSGGPLLNTAGEVIGINAQIASSQSSPFDGSGAQGSTGRIGFAIPSNTATHVITALKRAGR
jgi:putative serine protease PepD